ETVNAPLANNTAVATLNVVPARTPRLVFKTMSSAMGNYDMTGFDDIIERATALLPVSGFRTFINHGVVRKPSGFLLLERDAFNMPGDKDLVLPLMALAHAFTSNPPGCEDTHWIGTFPSSINGFNGIGGTRGASL